MDGPQQVSWRINAGASSKRLALTWRQKAVGSLRISDFEPEIQFGKKSGDDCTKRDISEGATREVDGFAAGLRETGWKSKFNLGGVIFSNSRGGTQSEAARNAFRRFGWLKIDGFGLAGSLFRFCQL